MQKVAVCAVACLLFHACTTVPITGRKQLSFVPESSMVEMSLTNYSQFISQSKLSTDQSQIDAVNRVGKRISAAVEKYMAQNGLSSRIAGYKWEFNVVQSDEMNAWCMPGGKVVFYTGILPITQNDAGIAVVMGHEIAHAVARHGNERMSQELLTQMGGLGIAEATKKEPAQTQSIFMAVYGASSQLAFLLPYSRTHEMEADRLGLIFMSMAGYDPNEAVHFWERMEKNGGAAVPEFLSTHPSEGKRIDALKKLIPESMKYYQN